MSWLTDILLLAVLLTVFYFTWLGSYPLFTPDEGRYSEVAREMLLSGDYVTPRVNGVAFLDKPALYYWLQASSMHAFGINEWAIRFFPALFGIAGCLLSYVAGRTLFNRRTGVLAASMLATSPIYFCCAHYANLDLEVAVLISTALLLFLMAALGTRYRFLLFTGAYIFTGLAFLTKGLIAIAFPGMIAGLWIFMLRRWRLIIDMHLILGIFIIAAIAGPWFVLVQRANPEFLHFFFVTQQVTRFLSAAEFNNPTPIWFYLPVVFAGFLPWSGFLIQSLYTAVYTSKRAIASHAAELFLMLWAGVIFIFFSIPHSKTISYILPVLPPLALLTARYFDARWDQSTKTRGITFGIALLIGCVTLFSFVFFLLPRFWLDMPINLMPTFLLAGLESALTAIYLAANYRRLLLPQLFKICMVFSAVLLLTITAGAKYMNPNSAQPLIAPLQKVLKPGDTVVNYFKFYQDVPIYLGRTVLLVADWDSPTIAERDNWVREMWYSMPFQDTSHILLNEKTFWKRWHSSEKMYVFFNRNYFSQFTASAGKYYPVSEYRDIMLVTNHK
jgi:4-amino-4-deoxy-L-arabinose transferase-like glycosyltransferase